MMRACFRDNISHVTQPLRLAAIAMAIAFLAASCNGVQPDPNSFDFVNSRGDP